MTDESSLGSSSNGRHFDNNQWNVRRALFRPLKQIFKCVISVLLKIQFETGFSLPVSAIGWTNGQFGFVRLSGWFLCSVTHVLIYTFLIIIIILIIIIVVVVIVVFKYY